MNPPGLGTRPARLLLVALFLVVPLLPPEARGESLAGSAILIALLVAIAGSPPAGIRRSILLAVGAACLGIVLPWHPSALEPLSILFLAALAGAATGALPESVRRGPVIPWALAASGSLVALYALAQRAWGLSRAAALVAATPGVPDREAVLARLGEGRAFAGFATPAAMGGFVVLALAVTSGLAAASTGKRRVALVGLCCVEVAGLVAGASATAAAALAVALAIFALVRANVRRAMLAAALLAFGLVISVAVLRWNEIGRPEGAESPWRLRAGNFRAAAAMAVDHPWLGVGPGGFGGALAAYLKEGENETRFAHDLPLQLAAETGIPAGIVLSVLFFWLFLRPLLSRPREPEERWETGARVALAAFALQNLGDFTAFLPSTLWTAALLRGALGFRPDPRAFGGADSRIAGSRISLVLPTVGFALLAALSGLSWNARFAARERAASEDLGAARVESARAARLAPWSADAAMLNAEMLLASAGDPGAALRESDRAVGLSPGRSGVRIVRARARAAAGDVPGAYADALEASRLYPRNPDASKLRDGLARSLPSPGSAEGRR